MEVNGKFYPMWGGFVEKKENLIGKTLIDRDCPEAPTKIIDVKLEPNGETSAMFSLVGEDFTWCSDVEILGFGGGAQRGEMSFSNPYMGCTVK